MPSLWGRAQVAYFRGDGMAVMLFILSIILPPERPSLEVEVENNSILVYSRRVILEINPKHCGDYSTSIAPDGKSAVLTIASGAGDYFEFQVQTGRVFRKFHRFRCLQTVNGWKVSLVTKALAEPHERELDHLRLLLFRWVGESCTVRWDRENQELVAKVRTITLRAKTITGAKESWFDELLSRGIS